MKTLVRMKFGSHLYGTDTPASDLDFKSVFVPDARDILLQRVQTTISTKRAKQEGEKNFAGEVDEEAYALHRFMQLIAEGQTVSLDMLFASPQSLLHSTRCWEEVVANRKSLLTKKSAAFVGYCRTQANKYGIRGSRVAAAKAAAEMFTLFVKHYGPHARVGELAGALEKFVSQNQHCGLVSIPDQSGNTTTMHFECCNKKMPFTNSLKSAAELYTRIYEEYGHRARAAEANEGIDWKALSHAVRVAREALELLETAHITFPLPYAAHILNIKLGKLTYNVVADEIEKLLEAVEAAAEKSTLPEKPDYALMENIVLMEYGAEAMRMTYDAAWVPDE